MLKKIMEERKKGKNLTTWVWKTLNAPVLRQRKHIYEFGGISYQHLQYRDHLGGLTGSVDVYKCYDKIIPDAVLTTAETILKNFKKEDPIVLLVSDYAVVQPDPFLAVTVPGYPFLIVDFWDEPGFQPKAAPGQNLE